MEKPRPQSQVGILRKLLRQRKVLAGVGVLGGLLVLKSAGCFKGASDQPEAKKPVLVEQAPAVNKSQQKAREALKVILTQKPKPIQEVHVPDDVGFGGPEPELESEESDDVSKLDEERKAFMELPHEKLQELVEETGFDELFEMRDYFSEVDSLRDAIKYGAPDEEVRQAALEVIRECSFWAEGSEYQKRYVEVRRKIINEQGREGRRKVKSIKKVLVATYHYAQLLASR